MYEVLIAHLRECAKLDASNNTYTQAADVIEELQKRVPKTPHGRCIDADALINKHFGKEFLSKVMTADEDDMGTALVNIPLVINNAPTIIPAEEGET